MSKKGDIYLGVYGSEYLLSAFGRTLTIADEDITREGRTFDGTLVRDKIATKTTITLSYSLIGGSELATLKTIYALDTTLSLQIYHTDNHCWTRN